jgi:hypothetical protein
MNKDEIKKVMEKQVEKLENIIKEMNIPEPIQICINNIDKVDESTLETIKKLNKKPIVYLIMLKSKLDNSNTPENINKLFVEIKEKRKADGKGDWDISYINDTNWKQDSRCLYVGRSYGKIVERMNQHIGIGDISRNTYSLWLKDWFRESKLPQEIEIYFLVFEENKPSEDIYTIEDLLWRGLEPLFGRSGKSPKSN